MASTFDNTFDNTFGIPAATYDEFVDLDSIGDIGVSGLLSIDESLSIDSGAGFDEQNVTIYDETVQLNSKNWFIRPSGVNVWDSTFDGTFGIEEFDDINLAEIDMFPEISLPVDSEINQDSVAEFHNDVDLHSDADTGDSSDGIFENIINLISEHLIIFDLEMDDVFNENRTLTGEGQILFDILGNYVGSLGLTITISDFYDIVSELLGELNLSSGSTIQFDTSSAIEKSLTLSANARIRFVGLLKGRLTIIGSKWIKGPKNIR